MAVILGRKGGGSGGGGGPPSGAAGGDLSGTYPNPDLSAAKQAELDAKVPKSLYDANTVLAANADDTPAAITMGASTILARLAAGNIKAASVAEIITLLGVTPGLVQLYDNTASGSIANWDVSSISGSYSQLMIVVLARGDTNATATNLLIRFNNDSGNNYYNEELAASGSSATAVQTLASSSARINGIPALTAVADSAAISRTLIPSYAGTTFKKGFTTEGGRQDATSSGNTVRDGYFGLWASTAAITRVTIFPAAGNLIAGSRLTIYGMA